MDIVWEDEAWRWPYGINVERGNKTSTHKCNALENFCYCKQSTAHRRWLPSKGPIEMKIFVVCAADVVEATQCLSQSRIPPKVRYTLKSVRKLCMQRNFPKWKYSKQSTRRMQTTSMSSIQALKICSGRNLCLLCWLCNAMSLWKSG